MFKGWPRSRVTPSNREGAPSMSIPSKRQTVEPAVTSMNRNDVTELIISARRNKQLSWSSIADHLTASLEWATAACLGQMPLTTQQAEALTALLDLPPGAALVLQEPPFRGSLATSPPSDPLIYRLHEMVSVYGTTIKELIQEEFGDGIMSAIDFAINITRESNPAGDRVNLVLNGKFLPYRQF
jgi:cyanate lyase